MVRGTLRVGGVGTGREWVKTWQQLGVRVTGALQAGGGVCGILAGLERVVKGRCGVLKYWRVGMSGPGCLAGERGLGGSA